MIDDTLDENTENFTVGLQPNSATNVEAYENVVLSNATVTTSIIDNDFAPAVSSVQSDDDYVNENTDTNTTNDIVQNGTIQNIGSTDTITISGSSAGLTSNGQPVTYSWNATTKTLTASSSEGPVFTLAVNSNNTGYTFTQLGAIDHLPTVQGESESKVLNFELGVQGGISVAPFSVTVFDDAPTVSGNVSIVTSNDGSYSESGYLTQATVSNDVTSIEWDIASLPTNLVYEGHAVTYVDDGNGNLIGTADGVDVFKVSIDPSTLNSSGNPEYSFELLNSLGRLGIIGEENAYTVISGGNIDLLELGFGTSLINSMTAVDGDGNAATVNTNHGWVGVGGNWIDNGDQLFMTFKDPSGEYGQVKGMDMLVEGQGGGSYTLNWTVTAAIDAAGNTVTYSGSVTASDNTDTPFTIPLQNGAIYFTALTISAPATVTDEFRIAFSAITADDYYSDIPINFGYSLIDADGDTASGAIGVTLTPPILPTTNDTTGSGNEDTTIAVVLSGADADGTVEGYKISELPANGILYKDAGLTQVIAAGEIIANSTVYFKPTQDWNGTTTFKYSAVDNDGNIDVSPATGTITVAPLNDTPTVIINSTNDTVYESGLSFGTNPSSNGEFASGTITVGDPDGLSDIKSITIGSTVLTVGSSGLAGLVGTTVITTDGKVTLTGYNNGVYDYQYELTKATTDVANQTETDSFLVKVTDNANTTAEATVVINIEDDRPSAVSLIQGVQIPQIDHNVLIVLDVSYSMLGSNLTAAKAAIGQLLTQYSNMGNVSVQVVTFGTSAGSAFSSWTSVAAANSYIQNLSINTSTPQYTNYDAAIEGAMQAFATSGKISGANNVSYFLTDGLPTAWVGYSDGRLTNNTLYDADGTKSTIRTYTNTNIDPVTTDAGLEDNEVGSNGLTWTQFLNNNDINSYAVGFGGASGAQDQLAPIAYDGTGAGSDPQGNVLVSPSLSELTKVLLSTMPAAVSGSLLTGVTPGMIGADGGFVSAISADGKVYTWNQATDSINVSGTGTSTYTWDAATNKLTVYLGTGGTFEVIMDSGAYKYWSATSGSTDLVGFTLQDNDGDVSSGSINMISTYSASQTLVGTDGDDVLIGGTGVDSLSAGAGNDILYTDMQDSLLDGGSGIDTLIFTSNTTIDFSGLNTANNPIKNIEVIDLSQNGDHNLTHLSYADVIDMTDTNNTLKILGDTSADKVQLNQADGWTNTGTVVESGHTFDVYTAAGVNPNDPTVTVKIEQVIDNTVG